jgi:hypothetical protein
MRAIAGTGFVMIRQIIVRALRLPAVWRPLVDERAFP